MEIRDYFYKTLLILVRIIPFSKVRRKVRAYIRSLYAINVLSQREESLQLKIRDYLKSNYVEPYLKANIDYSHLFKAKKQIKANSVIWQYWAQGIDNNTPQIVKASIKSVDKFKGSYEHVILTDNNIIEYLEIPKDLIEKHNRGLIPPTFFSDFLRVTLLSLYGGVWVDATVLLTQKIPKNILSSDFFMFERNLNLDYKSQKYWIGYDHSYFGFNKNFQVKCLNSFIIAKKDNHVTIALRDLLYLYWSKENWAVYYYFFQIMYNILGDIDANKFNSSIFLDDTLPHEIRKYLDSRCDDKLLSIIHDTCFVHKLKYIRHIYGHSLAEYIIKNS